MVDWFGQSTIYGSRGQKFSGGLLTSARAAGCYLLGGVLPVEEFPACLFLGPVQSFGECYARNRVNKSSELVFGQISAESFEPLRYFGPNSGKLFSKLRVLEERFHRFSRCDHSWIRR
jgi:hypothetical protein